MPEQFRSIYRQARSHWREWRYGKRGIPVNACGESFRFRLGYEPVRGIPGKFWEDNQLLMQMFYDTVTAGQTVLDVGAFVGHFTLLAARKVGPNGRVVAFEPCPASYRILLQHLGLNDMVERVEVWPFAVANSNGFEKIYFQEHDPVRGHNSTSPLPFEQKGLTNGLIQRAAPCFALGPFLKAVGVEPDVIKIDVEGAEIEVLQSLSDIL